MQNIQYQVPVVANEKITKNFFRMGFDAPMVVKQSCPGQFVHVRVADTLEPFFRRPFSIHRAKKHLEIFYEVVGRGTGILSEKKPGDVIDILGPLGNGFSLPPAGIKHVVMIAGGIGVAPFLFLCDRLRGLKKEIRLLYGGRTREHVFSMTEFKRSGCMVHVATDDGSVGTKGRVSKLFPKMGTNFKETFVYVCGPHAMARAVQQFAKENGVKGQVSCEERMACGLGACLGCAVKTAQGYKTACYDGPVFDLDEVILD